MPDDPRLTIPVLLGNIRAGRRSAHVARLLLGQFEGGDEVATALIDLVDLDFRVMQHRLAETDAAPPAAVGLSEKMSRPHGLVIVAPVYKNGYTGSLENALDQPLTSRDPKLATRVRPFLDELIWYVRALVSPRGRSVESGSP